MRRSSRRRSVTSVAIDNSRRRRGGARSTGTSVRPGGRSPRRRGARRAARGVPRTRRVGRPRRRDTGPHRARLRGSRDRRRRGASVRHRRFEQPARAVREHQPVIGVEQRNDIGHAFQRCDQAVFGPSRRRFGAALGGDVARHQQRQRLRAVAQLHPAHFQRQRRAVERPGTGSPRPSPAIRCRARRSSRGRARGPRSRRPALPGCRPPTAPRRRG